MEAQIRAKVSSLSGRRRRHPRKPIDPTVPAPFGYLRDGTPRARPKRELTPNKAKANRTRAWKHGRTATVVTVAEARLAQLKKIHPDLPQILQAVIAALQGDGLEFNAISAQAIAEAEVLRRETVERIRKDGVAVEDQILNSEGNAIGVRTRAHPLIEQLRHLHAILGQSAEEMRLHEQEPRPGRARRRDGGVSPAPRSPARRRQQNAAPVSKGDEAIEIEVSSNTRHDL